MKSINYLMLSYVILLFTSCNQTQETSAGKTNNGEPSQSVGQSGVKDDVSNPNIVQVAAGSKDHTTLVTALEAAELIDALSNAGPFTVFAPTNAAFDKLPEGTLDDLLKPEKKQDLSDLLGYHTYVGVINGILLQDGAEYDMVYEGKVKITTEGDKTFVNGSEIKSTIKTSNGVLHIIEDVLQPK